jgi:hypothetical protein
MNPRLTQIRATVSQLDAREWELRGAPMHERAPIWAKRRELMAEELAELARIEREKVKANG